MKSKLKTKFICILLIVYGPLPSSVWGGESDFSASKKDQLEESATTSIIIKPYIRLEHSPPSISTILVGDHRTNGLSILEFREEFKVASNADHQLTISLQSISTSSECETKKLDVGLPSFDLPYIRKLSLSVGGVILVSFSRQYSESSFELNIQDPMREYIKSFCLLGDDENMLQAISLSVPVDSAVMIPYEMNIEVVQQAAKLNSINGDTKLIDTNVISGVKLEIGLSHAYPHETTDQYSGVTFNGTR